MLMERMQRALERRIVLANGVAAFAIPVYLLATGRPPEKGGWALAIIIGGAQAAVLLGILALIAVRVSRGIARRNTSWLTEGRDPTPEERQVALTAPLGIGLLPLPFWLVGAIVIAAWPGAEDLGDRSRIFVGIFLGGVLACALTYVLVDRENNDLRAAALAGAAPDQAGTIGLRLQLIAAWVLGSGIPLVGIAVTPAVRSAESPVPLAFPIAFLALVGLAAGLFVTSGAAASIAEPMDDLRAALDRVHQGDLDATLTVNAGGEIGMVQAGFNQMVAGLREREQLRDLFGRHVGEEVARAALEQGASLGGEQREVSVFFVDLVGSSALARETAPDRVVALLNRFFAAVVGAADSEGGWVNKFEGDAALCVFGAPNDQPDHAARALRAARKLRDALGNDVEAGIGVSSGTVVAGNVGTEARYEYTVIGHPVNEAARLTDEAKHTAGRVLAGAASIALAGDEAKNWDHAGSRDLRGTGLTQVWTA